MQKRIVICACLFLLAWVLTLGGFHERSVSSSCSIAGRDAWESFRSGETRVCPNMWIEAEHEQHLGVPYLFYSTSDRPPYSLACAFSIRKDDKMESLLIDAIQIEYRDGSVEDRYVSPKGTRLQMDFEWDVDSPGEVACRSANFRIPAAIHKRQAVKVTIIGTIESDTTREPYRETVDVAIRDQTYFYPGWFAWSIRGL